MAYSEQKGPENFEAKRGENVTIHAVFMRHGEKETSVITPDTRLTEKGREGSREVGRQLDKREVIKAYSSDTERTRETADLVVGASATERKLKQRIRKELAFPYDKDGSFVEELSRIKRQMLGDNFAQLQEDERRTRLERYEAYMADYYLSFGDKQPDTGTLSPVQIAAMGAKRIDVFSKIADKCYSGSDVELINVTHDFNIESLLKELMIRNVGGKDVRGFEKIEEIGGPIRFNEGFEVLVETDAGGNKELRINFRGEQYKIDTKRLSELVAIADKMKEEK
jgi:Histidine phosphatase superfamily (branch 1)